MPSVRGVDENTQADTNRAMGSQRRSLIDNAAAEAHFHSHFRVESNVLARTKETLENYLVKRIAQLNNGRRALSTSRQDHLQSMMNEGRHGFDQSMRAHGFGNRNVLIGTNNGFLTRRHSTTTKGYPSRTAQRNEELRMLSLMQRSKQLSKNLYQGHIDWGTQNQIDRKGNAPGMSMLPKIDSLHDTTVSPPFQEAHLSWAEDSYAYRGSTVPSQLRDQKNNAVIAYAEADISMAGRSRQ